MASLDPDLVQRLEALMRSFEKALGEFDQRPSATARETLRRAADELMRGLARVLLDLGGDEPEE